jgi:catechol 2,3-dioxygenase-like lactoylglutathione lyase family enzyme
MLEHVSVPVSQYERAKKFYTAALKPLGYRLWTEYPPEAAGFAEGGSASLWIAAKKKKVQPIHVAFRAKSKKAVQRFHEAALAHGAKDNGGPGFRLETATTTTRPSPSIRTVTISRPAISGPRRQRKPRGPRLSELFLLLDCAMQCFALRAHSAIPGHRQSLSSREPGDDAAGRDPRGCAADGSATEPRHVDREWRTWESERRGAADWCEKLPHNATTQKRPRGRRPGRHEGNVLTSEAVRNAAIQRARLGLGFKVSRYIRSLCHPI